MMEQQLSEIMDVLPTLGIEKAILTGDMVSGDYFAEQHHRPGVCPRNGPSVRAAGGLLRLPHRFAGRHEGTGVHAVRIRRVAGHAAGAGPSLQTGESDFRCLISLPKAHAGSDRPSKTLTTRVSIAREGATTSRASSANRLRRRRSRPICTGAGRRTFGATR